MHTMARAVSALVPAAAAVLVVAGCSSSAPAAVKGFDEAGVSVGTGNAYTAADWRMLLSPSNP